MAVPSCGAGASAPQQGSKLAELLNPEAAKMGSYKLKVLRSQFIHYQWGKEPSQKTQKVQCLLQSEIPDQYCLGVGETIRKDQAELKKLQEEEATSTLQF